MPPYENMVCRKCGHFSYDDVFEFGFEESTARIRAAGDIISTDDGFYCVNERLHDVIREERLAGVKMKPAGKTGWHVLNLTARFEAAPGVYKLERGPCAVCGRNREMLGMVD